MVSTRQMTGGSSDESSLYFLRATPTASSSAQSCSSAATSSSNAGPTVASSSGKAVTTSSTCQQNAQSLAASPLGIVGILSSPCASHNLANSSTPLTAAMPTQAILPNARDVPQRPRQDINLMDLPAELLRHIFSFVGFKKIAQMRVISHQMNQVCSSILNSTFQKLQNQMHSRFQTVKAKMPRRESARRNHPLACECDILETCYMRLSLLQMTFGKHIERKHCCFFPGAILDEVYSVLRYIRTSPALDRPFKVTDELFDLSTMAMEYFKEHIEPNLPDIAYFTNSTKSFAVLETSSILSRETSHSNSSSPPQSNMVLRKGIRKIKQGMKRYNNQLTVLRSELRTCKRKATEQAKTITEQQKLLAEQQKQTLEFANRLDETDKKNEELSRKFSTVLQELNKCKTELQYWRSNSPTNTISKTTEQAVLGPEEHTAFGKSKDSFNEIEILSLSMEESDSPAGIHCTNSKDKDEHDQTKNQGLHPSACKSRAGVAVNLNAVTSFESAAFPSTLLKPGQKRKMECVAIAEATHRIIDAVGDTGISQLESSGCLNPPFSLASLAASFSSSAIAATTSNCTVPETTTFSKGFQSTFSKNDATQQHVLAVRTLETGVDETIDQAKKVTGEYDTVSNLIYAESTADESCGVVPSTHHSFGEISNDHLHTNTCANVSSCSNSRHCTISNDNTYQNKKLRRVQNKARSQSNKHINHSSVASTHTKATRSKHSDK